MARLIEATAAGMNDLLRNIDVTVDKVFTAQASGLAAVCIDIANSAKENHTFQNRTENLENSIQPDPVEREGDVLVGPTRAGMEYAAGIEMGNLPHTIPNAFGKGITVHHPGNAPMPFMEPAKEANKDNLLDTLTAVTNRVHRAVKVTK